MAAHRPHAPMLGPYQLIRTIGEGEFGKVKLAVHSGTGGEVAIKLCKKSQVVASPNGYTKLMREISTLKMVRSHPYIITLIEVIETEVYIAIVMELAKGGELFEHILANRCLAEDESRKLFAQIICAVGFIHSIGVVHRDLKLENILLDGSQSVLVTDFGFANKSLGPESFLKTSCGSPCYAAPELVTSDGYVGETADIWSCGVILFSMIAGYLPYDDDPNNPDGENINLLYNYIMETKLEFPDYVPEDCRHLINRILVPDPKYRAGIDEIMNHVWLQPVRHMFVEEMSRRKAIGYIKLTGPGFSPVSESPTEAAVPMPRLDPVIPVQRPEATVSTNTLSPIQESPATTPHKAKPVPMESLLQPPPTPPLFTKPVRSSERIDVTQMDVVPSHSAEAAPVVQGIAHVREEVQESMVVEDLTESTLVVEESDSMVVDEEMAEAKTSSVESDNFHAALVVEKSLVVEGDEMEVDAVEEVSREGRSSVASIPEVEAPVPFVPKMSAATVEESIAAMSIDAVQEVPLEQEAVLKTETIASTTTSRREIILEQAPSASSHSTVPNVVAAMDTLQPSVAEQTRVLDNERRAVETTVVVEGTVLAPVESLNMRVDSTTLHRPLPPIPVIPPSTAQARPPSNSPSPNRTMSPDETPRNSNQTVESPVHKAVEVSLSPTDEPRVSTQSHSSNSTITIPERADSTADDGFVFLDGSYLHVTSRGVVNRVLEKDLPATPSVVAERKADVSSSERQATPTAPRPRTAFESFMVTGRYSTPLDGEPKALRGMTDARTASKKVSIQEPAFDGDVSTPPPQTAPSVSRGSWFGTKKGRSDTPDLTRSETFLSTIFRPKSQTPRSPSVAASPAPVGYGLNTQKYQEPSASPSSNLRAIPPPQDFSSTTLHNTSMNSEIRHASSKASSDLAFQALPLKLHNRSSTSQSFVQPRFTPVPIPSGTPSAPSFEDAGTFSKAPVEMPGMVDRSATVLSLSASEYYVQFAADPRSNSESAHASWEDKKIRVSSGTVDHRAISRRNPESLLADLEVTFEQRGFQVASRRKEGEYRIKVTRPGYLARRSANAGEEDPSGVPVSVQELSKFMQVPREFTETQQTGIVSLPPSVSRTISKNEKLKQTSKVGRMLSGLPASLAKKVKYVKEYGLQYNNGFAPKRLMALPSTPRNDASASPASADVQFVDEIVFYAEIQKVPHLPGVYCVTFKRVRGNIWEFKKLYDHMVEDLPLL
ncbi:hypothetical protein HDU98_000896 [Podochytrium sp. JEL0797]|nr:hypothetical protein HDU98_000896 [Podochytrium sp. JEL0797]